MGARTDKIFGRSKQALGAVTGNEKMKREGQRREDKGKLTAKPRALTAARLRWQ